MRLGEIDDPFVDAVAALTVHQGLLTIDFCSNHQSAVQGWRQQVQRDAGSAQEVTDAGKIPAQKAQLLADGRPPTGA